MKLRPAELAFDVSELGNLTTKQALSLILDACPRSITSYHALALACLPDYVQAFPKANKGAITRYPLSPYQCWVIHRIRLALKLLTSEELRYLLIEDYDYAESFGRDAFDALYPPPAGTHPASRHDAPESPRQIPQDHPVQAAGAL